MIQYRFRMVVFLFIMIFFESVWGQNNLVSRDSVLMNSEKFEIQMNTKSFNELSTISFGDYFVENGSNKIRSESSKPNRWFFATKLTNKHTSGYSFLFKSKSNEKATVEVSFVRTNFYKKQFEINVSFVIRSSSYNDTSVDQDEADESMLFVGETYNFDADISINDAKNDIWHLEIKKEKIGGNDKKSLVNGDRKIEILSINDNKDIPNNRFPAVGYEFYENGNLLGSLQYDSDDSTGINKSTIWIDKSLSSQMKFILTASMTSIIEYRNFL